MDATTKSNHASAQMRALNFFTAGLTAIMEAKPQLAFDFDVRVTRDCNVNRYDKPLFTVTVEMEHFEFDCNGDVHIDGVEDVYFVTFESTDHALAVAEKLLKTGEMPTVDEIAELDKGAKEDE